MSSLGAICCEDLRATWDSQQGFARLLQAARQLGTQPCSVPADAGMLLLDQCAATGQHCYLADYVHEICADPSVSSPSVDEMALLDGDLLHSWLSKRCGEAQQQLQDAMHPLPASEEVCALRVRMRGYQVANTALRLAGLDSKAVNDGAGHVISLRTTCIASSNA